MEAWFNFDRSPNSTPPNVSDAILIDHWSRIFTVVQFSVIGSLGVLSNCLPILVTALGYVKWDVVNGMLINLACTELLLCLSFLFGQSFYVLWREWLPLFWCHFLSFIHFVSAFASFMFPPMLAINRYISLYKPQKYDELYTKNNVILMISACWIFCTLVPFTFVMAGETGFDQDNDHCCILVKDTIWVVLYCLFIISPLVLCCDSVMIYCNYKIYLKLKHHTAQVTMISSVVRQHKELLYFLFADMILPICFHSTYHIFKFALVNRNNEFLKRFFISLYLINSILRGLITVLMLKPYRKAVKRLFGKKQKVNPLNNVYPSIIRVGVRAAGIGTT